MGDRIANILLKLAAQSDEAEIWTANAAQGCDGGETALRKRRCRLSRAHLHSLGKSSLSAPPPSSLIQYILPACSQDIAQIHINEFVRASRDRDDNAPAPASRCGTGNTARAIGIPRPVLAQDVCSRLC